MIVAVGNGEASVAVVVDVSVGKCVAVGAVVGISVAVDVGFNGSIRSSNVRQPGSESAAPSPAASFKNCRRVIVRICHTFPCATTPDGITDWLTLDPEALYTPGNFSNPTTFASRCTRAINSSSTSAANFGR